MTWEFITKPVRSANAVSWEWAWRRRASEGDAITSTRTFSSFRDCVADARLNGFSGDAEPGVSGTLFQRPETRCTWS